jgi:hypothetical protein
MRMTAGDVREDLKTPAARLTSMHE